MLRTYSQAPPDVIHVLPDIHPIDVGCSGGWLKEAHQDGHGGGLPRSVVAQEGSDLVLVEVQAQVVHSQHTSPSSTEAAVRIVLMDKVSVL